MFTSVGWGCGWLLLIIGMIPAPVLFGSLIDRACLAWQQQPCLSEKGSCFTYDNWSMGTYFLTLIFCCKGLSLGFFFIALFLYRPPPTNMDVTAVVEVHNGSVPNDAWGSPPSSLRLLDSNGICDTAKIYSGQEKAKNGTTVWICHATTSSVGTVILDFVRPPNTRQFPGLNDLSNVGQCPHLANCSGWLNPLKFTTVFNLLIQCLCLLKLAMLPYNLMAKVSRYCQPGDG